MFFLFQSPLRDDGVHHFVGLGGEGLNQKVAETAGVNDSERRVGLSASDVLVHGGALSNKLLVIIFYCREIINLPS